VRADRLIAALLVLQARDRVTAAELSRELEVSERTARRDLEALALAGVPVYSQPGRGGGWSLVGGARTDLSGLTGPEARALLLVAGPAAATPEVKAALRKLVRALPESFRADAAAAAAAVVVDATGWDRSDRTPPEHLATVQQAIIDGRVLRLRYASRDQAERERLVHPLGLIAKGPSWYLITNTDTGMRTFRVDRIRSLLVTEEPVHRPEGFDLEEAWSTALAALDDRRLPARVAGRADRGVLALLRTMFGTRLSVGGPSPDGRVEFEIRGHSDEIVASELAGFGSRVEVLSPATARRHLARLGAELSQTYASVSTDRAHQRGRP